MIATRQAWTAVLFLFLCHSSAAGLNGATLVGDLSSFPEARGGIGDELVRVGERVFFRASTVATGSELWVSDGTAEGSRLVVDLYPGSEDSALHFLRPLGDGVVFVASDGRGEGPWFSDGTAAGTRSLLPASLPAGGTFYVNSITVIDECAWLGARALGAGGELWRYCPGDPSLMVIGDTVPGSAWSAPNSFASVNGRVLFNTSQGVYVGRNQSPTVAPFAPDLLPDLSIDSTGFTAFEGAYYFSGATVAHGRELWRTDGTPAGTERVTDLVPGSGDSAPSGLVAYNDALYFSAISPAHGRELMVSDGTAMGTRLVKDINPGAGSAGIGVLHAANEGLYFSATDGAARTALWRSDGTFAGTVALTSPAGVDLQPGFFGYTQFEEATVFFAASDQFGYELWRTADNQSIELVKDIYPGSADSIFGASVRFADALLFAANSPELGLELWATRGSLTTTAPLLNIGQDTNSSSAFRVVGEQDGEVLFVGPGVTATDSALWSVSPTHLTPRRLRNFVGRADVTGSTGRPNLGFFVPTDFGLSFRVSFGYVTEDSVATEQWIVRDRLVERIGSVGLITPQRLNDKVVSLARDGNLWHMTGEKGSLQILARPGGTGRLPRPPLMEKAAGLAFFVADSPSNRLALWQTDGSTQGTRIVDQTIDFDLSDDLRMLGQVDDAALFLAFGKGITLFRADARGVSALRQVGLLWSNFGLLDYSRAARLGGQLVFNVPQVVSGTTQLWVSDGTARGTVQLMLPARAIDSRLISYGPHVYFVAHDLQHGTALWRTDGTPQGTAVFADLEPGFDTLSIAHMVVHKDELYFVATTRASGDEIFKTDGQRVTQVSELLPGSLSGSPRALQSAGGQLWFVADDGTRGFEPWVLNNP